MTPAIRQYLAVTGCYWAFTLTDGALRMLVVLYFHGLGYSPLQVATLFLLYEFFGIITNLLGGWLAARTGLNFTLRAGLLLQVIALSMLLVDASLLSVAYVMVAQALSGIAKDLNKMSAKSSIKLLVPANAPGRLYRWVSLLTGSKNALKGIGFFVGAILLAGLGFQGAIAILVGLLVVVFLASLVWLKVDAGRLKYKANFREVFSKSPAVNRLSAARFFLFGARDVWFVVALPVFLQSELEWAYTEVGSLLAIWIIGYGSMQALAPALTRRQGRVPRGSSVTGWGAVLSMIPLIIAVMLYCEVDAVHCVVIGLLLFGAVFAINSAMHSYLIVSYAREEGVSLDVGFYYMANAAGRLIGTVLSGAIYQWAGFEACLLVSATFIVVSSVIMNGLPEMQQTEVSKS
ncbi:MAG: organoarsenical effux MFS transporter ArsJ [Pseudomonadales bacterium]